MKKSKFVVAAALALTMVAGISTYQAFQASALDGEYEGYPAEKMENITKQQRESIEAGKIKKVDNGGPLIIQEDPEVVTAILAHFDDPMSMKEINYVNGWRGASAEKGRAIVVGAGALTEDPSQGVVMVRKPGKPGTLNGETVLTPGKHGAVMVESYTGMNLTLVAEDGTSWVFNVMNGQFSDVK